jgi:hypothetical protein
MQSGRQLATDITRRLLREAQEKCRTTTTSTTVCLLGCSKMKALFLNFYSLPVVFGRKLKGWD